MRGILKLKVQSATSEPEQEFSVQGSPVSNMVLGQNLTIKNRGGFYVCPQCNICYWKIWESYGKLREKTEEIRED